MAYYMCFACYKKGDLEVEIVKELTFKVFHKYLIGLEKHLDSEVDDLYNKFQGSTLKESKERTRVKMKEFIGRRAQVRDFLVGIERGLK